MYHIGFLYAFLYVVDNFKFKTKIFKCNVEKTVRKQFDGCMRWISGGCWMMKSKKLSLIK